MKRFWCLYFIFWPIAAVVMFAISPAMNWWFPGESATALGKQIDDLFYLILVITAVTFVATQVALGYVLWKGATKGDDPALFTHGNHNLEVIWTIVPSGILIFIALYQMDVWAQYRVESNDAFPDFHEATVAEVTARQFEWRIRYPALNRTFSDREDVKRWLTQPEPGDLYTVNDLHVPSGSPVLIHLRSADVQHAFFVPRLRVKQDAVPNLIIPIWFDVLKSDEYELLCAELCGWGHYKMKARVVAQRNEEFQLYLENLQREQFDDGVTQAD